MGGDEEIVVRLVRRGGIAHAEVTRHAGEPGEWTYETERCERDVWGGVLVDVIRSLHPTALDGRPLGAIE